MNLLRPTRIIVFDMSTVGLRSAVGLDERELEVSEGSVWD